MEVVSDVHVWMRKKGKYTEKGENKEVKRQSMVAKFHCDEMGIYIKIVNKYIVLK